MGKWGFVCFCSINAIGEASTFEISTHQTACGWVHGCMGGWMDEPVTWPSIHPRFHSFPFPNVITIRQTSWPLQPGCKPVTKSRMGTQTEPAPGVCPRRAGAPGARPAHAPALLSKASPRPGCALPPRRPGRTPGSARATCRSPGPPWGHGAPPPGAAPGSAGCDMSGWRVKRLGPD